MEITEVTELKSKPIGVQMYVYIGACSYVEMHSKVQYRKHFTMHFNLWGCCFYCFLLELFFF